MAQLEVLLGCCEYSTEDAPLSTACYPKEKAVGLPAGWIDRLMWCKLFTTGLSGSTREIRVVSNTLTVSICLKHRYKYQGCRESLLAPWQKQSV